MATAKNRLPEYPGDIGAGARGKSVEHLQEWLCVNKYALTVDGYFGPVTVAALKSFQRDEDINPRASLTRQTWEALLAPMTRSLAPLSAEEKGDGTLPTFALAYAQRFLENGARELLNNTGPWVRLFMDGNEGIDYPWCAGFVTLCVRLGVEQTTKKNRPKQGSVWPQAAAWSVDRIAEWAMGRDELYRTASAEHVQRGSLFLVPRSGRDWMHIGFVLEYDDENEVVISIEGNTNMAGYREGIEVRRRFRSAKRLHFIANYG